MQFLRPTFAKASLAIWMAIAGSIASADEPGFQRAMAEAVRTAASRILPSVVAIEVIGTSGGAQGEVEQDAPTSGVIVDEQGHVLASSIVVARPSASVLVVLPDGTRQAAKVVAQDYHRDLVLLKIETENDLQPVVFDSATTRRVGQTVVAVGRYGNEASPMVSRGILSAEARLDGIALQCDARVSPALYGGPLIDLYGNVLGVLIPAVAEGGAEEVTSWYDSGIAFAIPSDVIVNKLQRLKAGKDVRKGLIGIVAKTSDPYQDGTEIAAVRSRSPAEAAGIKPGDQVMEVAGIPVKRHQEIRQVLGSYDAGESIEVKLQREGQSIALQVTLAETIPPLQPQRLGAVTRDQEEETDGKQLSEQVMVEQVVPGTPAEGQLQPGDVLQRIGETELVDSQTLRRLLVSAEPDQKLSLQVLRGGKEVVVSLTPQSISGKMLDAYPEQWKAGEAEQWELKDLKLPEAGNVAAYVAPKSESNASRLGMLILLLNPGQGDPEEVAKSWTEAAQEAGVVVCVIAPEDTRRWQPKEIEVVGNFVAAVMKQAAIDPAAVAVAASGALAGGSGEAADAMALAVAISQSRTFFGVAVSPKTRPPAVRLRENEASTSLQLMLPIEVAADLPTWATVVEKAGYPIVRGGEVTQESLLRWVRLLQSI
jgi:S1-C subfamily serine protease